VHQNCWTVQTGLQGILHDGQGIEGGGEKRSSSHPNVSANKRKNRKKKYENFFFFGGKSVIHGILLFAGRVWELNPCKKRGMSEPVRISAHTCSFNLIFRN